MANDSNLSDEATVRTATADTFSITDRGAEKRAGNAFNMVILGNAWNNVVKGGSGDDVLYGGAGVDVAVFGGKRGDYAITRVGPALRIADQRPGAGDGTDLLVEFETLRFADGDVAISALNAPAAASDWRLFAGDGMAVTLGDSGTIVGGAGFQDITVPETARSISLDSSFNRGGDLVHLTGQASEWAVVRSGSNAVFMSAGSVVTIPVGAAGLAIAFDDGLRSLRFDSAMNSMAIGSQAFGGAVAQISAAADGTHAPGQIDPAATGRLFLEEGASVVAEGKMSIIGTLGAEQVTLGDGEFVFDASFNRGGDTVHLAHEAQDFTAMRSGSSIILESEGQKIAIPVGVNGMEIDFGGEVRTLIYDAAAAHLLLGDQVITGSAIGLIA